MGRVPVAVAVAAAAALLALSGCLNTQSTALQEQPAPLSSPADACRAAAAAEGFTIIEVKNLREVSEGYWEADLVVQDPELRTCSAAGTASPGASPRWCGWTSEAERLVWARRMVRPG